MQHFSRNEPNIPPKGRCNDTLLSSVMNVLIRFCRPKDYICDITLKHDRTHFYEAYKIDNDMATLKCFKTKQLGGWESMEKNMETQICLRVQHLLLVCRNLSRV